jgi:hypothetical protein
VASAWLDGSWELEQAYNCQISSLHLHVVWYAAPAPMHCLCVIIQTYISTCVCQSTHDARPRPRLCDVMPSKNKTMPVQQGHMTHLPCDSDFMALLHQPPDIDVQPMDRNASSHEIVISKRVDVEARRCQLRVFAEETELVATLRDAALSIDGHHGETATCAQRPAGTGAHVVASETRADAKHAQAQRI